ncbi:DUF559 domain-containing protein [Nocardioides piscis]|uniref:DUF559 domain-containing protein n=1 Tax=Nocardioides piscis TaxID=2714938 RepID=A0A6G7YJE5_9ACTN|nr:DUF559 domain-containing protein [Nocardioides piscis]QIK76846.1 DUF559 domain-containing protein [Nocardioides piscis]
MADANELDPTRPFTRAAGLNSGLTRRELNGPDFRRLSHGILVSAAVADSPMLRTQAALIPFDGAGSASHCSAARVWGAPVATCPEEHITVSEPNARRRRQGVVCHVRADARTRDVGGIAVTELADLFVEMADELPLVELVVLGDWMLRRKGMTHQRLAAAVAAASGSAVRRARTALGYVRRRVDSPMETRLRMLLVLAGIPEPEVNREMRDLHDEVLRRYDLCWPGVKVVVEYDGRVHIEREAGWERDLVRREAIDDDGWRLLVVVAKDIYAQPERTVQRVFKVLRDRGLAGLPDRVSDDWRPHFPGRRAP